MNPPYSNPGPWCEKAVLEARRGKTVVGLLRGDTSTRWFHDWVLPYAEVRFIKGRLRFGDSGKPAPFPSIVAIWNSREMLNTTLSNSREIEGAEGTGILKAHLEGEKV